MTAPVLVRLQVPGQLRIIQPRPNERIDQIARRAVAVLLLLAPRAIVRRLTAEQIAHAVRLHIVTARRVLRPSRAAIANGAPVAIPEGSHPCTTVLWGWPPGDGSRAEADRLVIEGAGSLDSLVLTVARAGATRPSKHPLVIYRFDGVILRVRRSPTSHNLNHHTRSIR